MAVVVGLLPKPKNLSTNLSDPQRRPGMVTHVYSPSFVKWGQTDSASSLTASLAKTMSFRFSERPLKL